MKKRTKLKVFFERLCARGKWLDVFLLFFAITLFSSTWVFGQQKVTQTISIDFKKVRVLQALQACLKETGLLCKEQPNGKILVGPQEDPEFIQVTGRVVDEKGNVIPGASVLIQGTTQGVATDVNGNYKISVQPTDVLRVSFIGYETEVMELKGKTKVNIRLKPTGENQEKVTVVAYGEQKKESVVSAITTVDARTLKSSSSDLTTQFAGKIAGVIGWQTGGIPGALTEDEMNTKFYIRGIISFQKDANLDPLILIDGVESSKLDLSRMPTEDIESFGVMKDASATAMYGVRGANGVILITTKKGEAGSVYTSVRYEAVVSAPTRKIEVVDPVTYMKMYNLALLARDPKATPRYSEERIERTGSGLYPSWVYPANDWYGLMFENYSINHRAGLNLRGGSRLVQYYASVNYTRDEGMLKTDRLSQFKCNIENNTFSLRANLNIDLAAGVRLNVNASANLDKYHGPASDMREAYSKAFNASPVNFAAVYPGDNQYDRSHLCFGGINKETNNPYKELHYGYTDRRRYSTVARAEYIHNLSPILKGLELRAAVSLNKTGYFSNLYTTRPYMYTLDQYDFETGIHKLIALNETDASLTLEKDKSKSGSNQITRMAYEFRGLHVAAWDEHQTSLTAVFNMQESSSSNTRRNTGFSMRGTYGFRDRYFAEASFGYNGFERFADDHRFRFFPALGCAWVASKEDFFANNTARWLSFLKFRFSWGKVGNDGVIWEVAEQKNFGLEARLFGGIVEVNADLYQEVRHDILDHRRTIPATAGLEAPQIGSVGKSRSRGIDLQGKIQHSFSPDFRVILNGTFTYSKAIYKQIEEASNKPEWQQKKGHELSQTIGYIAEGLFRDETEITNSPRQGGNVMPGDIRYRDLNSDEVIDENDATYIGSPETPRVIYGFSGNLNYKCIEFSFSFQGSGKRAFFMDPMRINPFVDDRAMLKVIHDDHWSDKNMQERPFWPRLSTRSIEEHNPQENWGSGAEERKSTYFMRECSFLRCTAIEMAYNLPRRFLQKFKIQSVKVYARVSNPFLITNFNVWDVELGNNGFNYPIQRTWSLGLNVSF